MIGALQLDITALFERYTEEDPLPAANLLELLRNYMTQLELQYGPDVEVMKPRTLRDKVLNKLEHAQSIYRK